MERLFVITPRGKLIKDPYIGKRVLVPEFEIFFSPSIRFSEVKARRFDVKTARDQIMAAEDEAILKMIDAIEKSGNNDI